MPTFRITLLLLLALAVSPRVGAAPKPARVALSPVQRQAVVLMTAGRVEAHLGGLPKRSPAEAVAALRHVAHDYRALGALAREAGWTDMANYYAESAAVFARMVQGRTDRTTVDRQTRALELRRERITGAAIARFGAAHVDARDPRLGAMAARFAARIESAKG